jgi:hypothetical protein
VAFTVQADDGTTAEANAYCDVSFFKGYHDDRGGSYGTATDPAIQKALILATDYVDARWRSKFRGLKLSSSQTTEWPRESAYDDIGGDLTGVPRKLKFAVCEYALRVIKNGSLLVDALPPVSATGEMQPLGPVTEVTIKAGPVEQSTKYGDTDLNAAAGSTTNVTSALLPAIPAADLMVESLLRGLGGQRVAIR